MALALVVNFTVKPGHAEMAKDLIRKMETHSRQELGCRHYAGHQSVYDPSRFVFYELFDDQAALDAHRASPHFEQYVTNGLSKLVDTRVSDLFETVR